MLDDAAQGFRRDLPATASSARCADATATSFFPAKPLGCYGDGGAVFTDDDELADDAAQPARARRRAATNTTTCASASPRRLDTIQAAVLIEKLKIFPDEIAARNRIARRYSRGARRLVDGAARADGMTSVWAQYTIRVKPGRATRFAAALKAAGHPDRDLLPEAAAPAGGLRRFPCAEGGLPVTDRLAEEVISLPMHAYLDEPTQDRIIAASRRALARPDRRRSPIWHADPDR